MAINSYATENPNFIKEAVKTFGSSTIMINIEAKQINDKNGKFINFMEEKTGLDLKYWLEKVQDYDCGEIILTSVDKEGLQNGMDFEMLESIINKINRPLIFSGGFAKLSEIKKLKEYPCLSLSIASVLHYNELTVKQIKNA